MMNKEIVITQFKWAGQFGPFSIKTSCGKCDLTTATLKDVIEKQFGGKDVRLEIKPWLGNILYCLLRGYWHAPIIMINGKRFYQFSKSKPLFDRAHLGETINNIMVTANKNEEEF